jgi:predicted KAP-like P-loop ATPase
MKNLIHRWYRAIAWGVLGNFIGLLVHRANWHNVFKIDDHFMNVFFKAYPILLIAYFVAIFCLIFGTSFRFAEFSHLNLKNQSRFPSYWFFFLMGYLSYFLFFSLKHVTNVKIFTPILLFIVAFLNLESIYNLLYDLCFKQKTEKSKKSLKQALSDHINFSSDQDLLKRIKTWADKEQPLGSLSEDIIGFEGMATQLLDEIEQNLEINTNHCIGIVGRFGTGKSSLIEGIRTKINKNKKFIYISVSCWEFDSTDSIEIYILKEISLEIKKHIYIPHLLKLPLNWLRFIKQASNFNWMFSFYEIFNSTSLDQSLEELSEALETCGYYLILIIEDSDRRKKSDINLGSLQRLLEVLKQRVQKLSIIIACDMEFSDGTNGMLDLKRLLDKSKKIPFIEEKTIESLLHVLVCTLGEEDKNWNIEAAKQFSFLWEEKFGSEGTVNYASPREFNNIVRTPRRLKAFIFKLCDGWENIKGRVNFFDYFLVTFLNVHFPDAIELFNDHIDILSKEERSTLEHRLQSEMLKNLPQAWEEIYSKYTLQEQLVVRKVLAMLFPNSYKSFEKGFEKVTEKITNGVYDTMPEQRIIESNEIWRMACTGRLS